MKRYFRIVYPYVNAGWYLAILGWHLRYLFGKTDYHNPLFKLMGMRMQRLGPHDTVPPHHTKPNVDAASSTVVTREYPITALTIVISSNNPPSSSRIVINPRPPNINIPS